MEEALSAGVSDIHFDATAEGYRIRFRQRGRLIDKGQSCDKSCIQSIKLQARMDLSDKASFRDGHFTWRSNEEGMEIRVSMIPTVHGAKFTLRCLPMTQAAVPLERLGMIPRDLKKVCSLLQARKGLILASGSTGSGKTTTLYAMASHLAKQGLHVISLENPVERIIPLVTQMDLDSEAFSFEQGIRAAIRQDPDVISIGEIRDSYTAAAAVQAALTGHLVLATIHAVGGEGTVARMMQLGIQPLFIRHSLQAVLYHQFKPECGWKHPLYSVLHTVPALPQSALRTEGIQSSAGFSMNYSAISPTRFSSTDDLLTEPLSAFVRGWLDCTRSDIR